MTKHHYVYKSFEEEGRDYIGCRSCDCMPEEDTKYFGSFKDKSFKPTGKTILFVCETRTEASEIEIELHNFFDVAVNPKFANRSMQTSTMFDTTGVPRTKAQRKAQSEKMSGENNPQFGDPQTEEWKKAHSERMSGRTFTEEWKQAQSERNSGEKHPNYGVPHTEEWKKAQSEKLTGRYFGALNPNSKAIIAIEPDGTQRHYGSVREATRELRIPKTSLCKWLKPGKQPKWGKFKGWQFLYNNSENFSG